MTKLLGLVGGKWGLIAILAGFLTIAALTGYIKYQAVKHEAEEISLRSKLNTAKRDIKERDLVITVMTDERNLFEARIAEITAAMESMLSRFSYNSQQRTSDVKRMTRPRPAPGVPADTSEMEKAANEGMNGIFNEMEEASRNKGKPVPAATPTAEGTAP
jgi:hypothetical protein